MEASEASFDPVGMKAPSITWVDARGIATADSVVTIPRAVVTGAARTAAVGDETERRVPPFGVQEIKRILQRCREAAVVFRCHDDQRIRRVDIP